MISRTLLTPLPNYLIHHIVSVWGVSGLTLSIFHVLMDRQEIRLDGCLPCHFHPRVRTICHANRTSLDSFVKCGISQVKLIMYFASYDCTSRESNTNTCPNLKTDTQLVVIPILQPVGILSIACNMSPDWLKYVSIIITWFWPQI